MFCSISGVTPEEPVVSRPSGLLFEKSLIEQYIAEHKQCPITKEPLTTDDLLPLKTSTLVKPRPASASSIPGLLGVLHSEWDALLLETFELRQSLDATRQELSHALYQHDAACRVIARVIAERDEARQMLREQQTSSQKRRSDGAAAGAIGENGDAEMADGTKRQRRGDAGGPEGIPEEVLALMGECAMRLSKSRKKRQMPDGLATADDVKTFAPLSAHPLHKSTAPGILAVAWHPAGDGGQQQQEEVLVTGGSDGGVTVFDRREGSTIRQLSAHSKAVTCVQFACPGGSDFVLSGSADSTVKVWQEDRCVHTLGSVHSSGVLCLDVHPTSKYFITGARDKTWAFHDVETGACMQKVACDATVTALKFHPDGLIMGTGNGDGCIRIYDVKSQQIATTFEGHKENGGEVVHAMSFSENGYYMASGSSDGIRVWDLRKLKEVRFLSQEGKKGATSVAFDKSGLFLAAGGADSVVKVYGTKQDWSELWSQAPAEDDSVKSGSVAAVSWGPLAGALAVGYTADRNLRFFGRTE